MRLINTTTLQLESFIDVPQDDKYAILSHTWGSVDEEVSFAEFQSPDSRESKKATKGYEKIVKTCEIAKGSGYKYAWVDTCCIDKSSSAELSESINSMYRWYRQAKVCFVYLQDFDPFPASLPDEEKMDEMLKKLEPCRWFKRGWTLQELIAPSSIHFFDSSWNQIGTKESLSSQLAKVARIYPDVLDQRGHLKDIPVACRMSWMAGRTTTRKEDEAYCLMGIFDVNMPLLYGEGAKAFQRLQIEIASQENDLSIFAWSRLGAVSMSFMPHSAQQSVFAPSPTSFRGFSDLLHHRQGLEYQGKKNTFSVVKGGVRVSAWVDWENRTLLDSRRAHRGDLLGLGQGWLTIRWKGMEDGVCNCSSVRALYSYYAGGRTAWLKSAKWMTFLVAEFDNLFQLPTESSCSIECSSYITSQPVGILQRVLNGNRLETITWIDGKRFGYQRFQVEPTFWGGPSDLLVIVGFDYRHDFEGILKRVVWAGLFVVDGSYLYDGQTLTAVTQGGTKKGRESLVDIEKSAEQLLERIVATYGDSFGRIVPRRLPRSTPAYRGKGGKLYKLCLRDGMELPHPSTYLLDFEEAD